MYADLHLHSTASDGLLSPRDVVGRAKQSGFTAIALTDHDSVAGLAEAQEAGAELGVEIISGIELSALENFGNGDREVHILGYFIDPLYDELRNVLGQIVADRESRTVRMVEKLKELGLDLDLGRIRANAGSEYLGRPHIARAMLEKGYISEMGEAFTEQYIGRGGWAYVERFVISPQEAIDLIIAAGGVAVLAHPGYLSDRSTLVEDDISRYNKIGIKGIEVYYSMHTLEQVEFYKGIALKLNLFITGGSDCHGSGNGKMGSVKLPLRYVEALKNAKQ